VLLALSAGCVDAVGFLTLSSIFTAHLSGDTTRLAVDLGSGEFTADALAFAVVIVTYVSGVVLGVAVVSANERRHRLLLLAEIACLVALMTIGTAARDAGELYRGGFFFYFLVALSALAMGLQTAYLRRTAGTSVQTTFITGMLTALAEDYVAWHRDRADIEARRRVAIHGSTSGSGTSAAGSSVLCSRQDSTSSSGRSCFRSPCWSWCWPTRSSGGRRTVRQMDVLADLVAEQDRLDNILAGLDEEAWTTESGAPGWTVADVVLHLAQSEEAVVATATATATRAAGDSREASTFGEPGKLDDVMDQRVRAERAAPREVFERWRAARRAGVAALRAADPDVRLQWAAAPLKPTTLATTRLAEHWAHGLDITGPFGIPFPDTDRLRHIAWLGHGSLAYAFALAGHEPHDVYCELTGPDGSTWCYGSPDADSTITGAAGSFCRVGAQRLAPDHSGLVTRGPYAQAALRVLRNYAG
jgi:uncharacterized protein (TIGR03084 family)